MQPLDTEFGAQFTEAERGVLDQVRYQLTDDRSASVLDLMVSWSLHVRRIDEDRFRSIDDPHTWGAHDLVAALSLRDFLEDCLTRLTDDDLRAKVTSLVATVDDHFMGITQLDGRDLVGQVADRHQEGKNWWWSRIPDSGPILDELLEYSNE